MAHGANEDGSLNIPVIQRPRRRTWFLDGDIVRMVHVSRAQGIVTLWNCTKELKFSMTMAEFKKKEKGNQVVVDAIFLERKCPRDTCMLP